MESAENSNSHSTYVSGGHTSSKPPSKQINQSINPVASVSKEATICKYPIPEATIIFQEHLNTMRKQKPERCHTSTPKAKD
jgi:hypothetical protein